MNMVTEKPTCGDVQEGFSVMHLVCPAFRETVGVKGGGPEAPKGLVRMCVSLDSGSP